MTHAMTPNGAIAFGLLVIAAAIAARDLTSLAVILALLLVFALASRRSIASALLWSAGIVLPLAAFMTLVWVGIVGRAPHEIAAGAEGSRAAAATYVTLVGTRLFAIAFAIQALFLHFSGWTPLAFVRAVTAPALVKKLLVLTLSLIETILHAIDRARTALIAGGLITRRFSWRNLRHGWILVQTVWLTVVVIAIGRTRDKWPVEGTLARLDGALALAAPRLTTADFAWGAAAPRVPRRRDRAALNARADRRRELLRPQRRADGAANARAPARRSSSGLMRRPRCPASPARSRTRSRSIARRIPRMRRSRRSTSRPSRRASRPRCQAASRCCSRCIASRGRTTRRSASTPRWNSSIR